MSKLNQYPHSLETPASIYDCVGPAHTQFDRKLYNLVRSNASFHPTEEAGWRSQANCRVDSPVFEKYLESLGLSAISPEQKARRILNLFYTSDR